MTRTALAVIVALTGAAGAARADTGVAIELNALEQGEGACTAYLAVDNRGPALAALTLDLVMFGADGAILRRLAVELGPLRAERLSVRAFAVEGARCDALGRVLLNEVIDCAAESGPLDGCFERIEARGRGGLEFVK